MIKINIPKVNNSVTSSLSNIIPFNTDNSKANTLSIGTEYDDRPAQTGGWFWKDTKTCNIDKVALRSAKQNKFSFVSELVLQDCIYNFGEQDENKNTILHYLVSYECKCESDKHINECVIVNNAIAKSLKHPKIKSFINIQNKIGDTPLHVVIKLENSNLAGKLISAGADKTIKNNNGENIKEVSVVNCEECSARHSDMFSSNKMTSNINRLIAIFNPPTETIGTTVTIGTPVNVSKIIKLPDTKNEVMSNSTDEIFNDIINKFVNVKQTGGYDNARCNDNDGYDRCNNDNDILECDSKDNQCGGLPDVGCDDNDGYDRCNNDNDILECDSKDNQCGGNTKIFSNMIKNILFSENTDTFSTMDGFHSKNYNKLVGGKKLKSTRKLRRIKNKKYSELDRMLSRQADMIRKNILDKIIKILITN